MYKSENKNKRSPFKKNSAHSRKSSNIFETRKNYFEENENQIKNENHKDGNNIYGFYASPQKIDFLAGKNSEIINGQLLKSELNNDKYKNRISKVTPTRHLRSSSMKMII
jgi:hypothetical protein